MKLATTTADFQAYARDSMDISAILPMLSQSNFRYVDLNLYHDTAKATPLSGDNWEAWADEIQKSADVLGLTFVQAHGSDMPYARDENYDFCLELMRREMLVCQKLGIRKIVVHGVSTQGGTRQDFVLKNACMYRDLLSVSEKTGVSVLTENTCVTNCPTYYLVDAEGFHALDRALGGHPLFGICWDVGHAHVEGVDQYREMTALGGRLKAVHIHDNLGRRRSPAFMDFHMQPYTGSVSYDAVIKALLDIDFQGTFTLEAYAVPAPPSSTGRSAFVKDGNVFDKLLTLPLEFKIRGEALMHDIARHMLESYGCYEE